MNPGPLSYPSLLGCFMECPGYMADNDDIPNGADDSERYTHSPEPFQIKQFLVQISYRKGFYLFSIHIDDDIFHFPNMDSLLGVDLHAIELANLGLHHDRMKVSTYELKI
jgi:hypothetical protein